jgi:hypothetical protein
VFADEVAAAWIDELGGHGPVPPVVTGVAGHARAAVAGLTHDGRIARARVRAESGRWLVVRASALGDEPGAQDHLKAIFEKVGVATRGELVARVFFQQRAPEL